MFILMLRYQFNTFAVDYITDIEYEGENVVQVFCHVVFLFWPLTFL